MLDKKFYPLFVIVHEMCTKMYSKMFGQRIPITTGKNYRVSEKMEPLTCVHTQEPSSKKAYNWVKSHHLHQYALLSVVQTDLCVRLRQRKKVK
jgi:hypothetical protein